jgi:tRNA modification GTPase
MTDTIAAIATGSARTAIGILRISGPKARQVAEAVFTPADGKPLSAHPSHTLVYGTLRDTDGTALDHCLGTYSVGPDSYTGEDTAELQCHGSPTMLAAGLESLFAVGARQALAGEFTRRAFLNGRLDLTQAEAVVDLIDAETVAAAKNAAGQLSGAISGKINGIYDRLVDLMAHFHAVLDYPDEDIPPFEAAEIARSVEGAARSLADLSATYSRGRQLTQGVPCAIVGRPNAGKSSLLNAILGYDRAIVTDIPGTTRDTVEERAVLGGVLLRLIDTAGLRDTGDVVEQMGVRRSLDALERAELALVVVDGSAPLDENDRMVLQAAHAVGDTIVLVNKTDLPPAADLSELEAAGLTLLSVSAREGTGLAELEAEIARRFPTGAERQGELLTNARQAEAAGRAAQALRGVQEGLASGMPPDMVLSDVEVALSALGELSGRRVTEDVTSRIFARFCVGK